METRKEKKEREGIQHMYIHLFSTEISKFDNSIEVVSSLCRGEGIREKHCYCHWPNTSGNWCNS